MKKTVGIMVQSKVYNLIFIPVESDGGETHRLQINGNEKVWWRPATG
jgi:hypothetical protein